MAPVGDGNCCTNTCCLPIQSLLSWVMRAPTVSVVASVNL